MNGVIWLSITYYLTQSYTRRIWFLASYLSILYLPSEFFDTLLGTLVDIWHSPEYLPNTTNHMVEFHPTYKDWKKITTSEMN